MERRRRLADNVPAVTAGLTTLSLLLVFGAAMGRIPAAAVPEVPTWVLDAIPHVNAAISAIAIVTIAVGWRAIRRGDVRTHRRAMMSSFGLFAGFLALYLFRLVSIGGASPFPGPTVVYRYLYLPILVVHMALAIICIPLLYYVLLLAMSTPVTELPRTWHPRVGRVATPLWLTAFALGIVVYLLLHGIY